MKNYDVEKEWIITIRTVPLSEDAVDSMFYVITKSQYCLIESSRYVEVAYPKK